MKRPRLLSSPRMSRFFVAGTSMYSPSTHTAHRQHQLLHNGAPGLIIPSSCNIFTCSLMHKISISSGHQRLYPCVPSLVHVPIPVCHLYMIRLWINLIGFRKQRQDGRLNPSPSLLSTIPTKCLRSKCCRRTQRLGREEQLRCQHNFSGIYLPALFTQLFLPLQNQS